MSLPIAFGTTPRNAASASAVTPSAAPVPGGSGQGSVSETQDADSASGFRSALALALAGPLGAALERARGESARDVRAIKTPFASLVPGSLSADGEDAVPAENQPSAVADGSRRSPGDVHTLPFWGNDDEVSPMPVGADGVAAEPLPVGALKADASLPLVVAPDDSKHVLDDAVAGDEVSRELLAVIAMPIAVAGDSPLFPAATIAIGSVPASAGDLRPAGESIAGARALSPNVADARNVALAVALAHDAGGTRRELNALVPEMRDRLERVVDRMRNEYGYTVDVVETVRTQRRQDELFAQGRTAPGPVVTWTRSSNHTTGRAVDVMIDGTYQNPAGFERLARVAREEGLRTLWPRDPGHIELVGTIEPAPDSATRSVLPLRRGDEVHTLPFPRTDRGNAQEPIAILPTRPEEHAPDAGRPQILPILPSDRRRSQEPVAILPVRPDERAPNAGGPHILPMPSERAANRRGDVRILPIQLDTEARAEPAPIAVRDAAPAPVARAGGIAQVAQVAQVARVAQVAQVAQVATVGGAGNVAPAMPTTSSALAALTATGGRAAPNARSARSEKSANHSTQSAIAGAASLVPPDTPSTGALPQPNESGSQGANGGPLSDERKGRGDGRDKERADAIVGERATTERDAGDASRGLLARETTALLGRSSQGGGAPVAGLAHTDASERIARMLSLQDTAADRPMSSILLRLEHPEGGGEDRVRIDLRGSTVGTTFDVSDPAAAENLRTHTRELQQALGRQGLDGETMVVRTATRSTDPMTHNASALAAERDAVRAGSASASDGGGFTAKDSRNQSRSEDGREGKDQQRSRQRREGKGER